MFVARYCVKSIKLIENKFNLIITSAGRGSFCDGFGCSFYKPRTRPNTHTHVYRVAVQSNLIQRRE